MKKEVQIFSNDQFGQVRTIEQSGKVYFCGKDVAEALGYQNTKKAIKDHCRVPGVTNCSLGVQTGMKADGTPAYQTVKVKFIDEGNLYRLITHSKLPSAEQFESWVFDEVLPTLRKTGTYSVKKTQEDKARMLATREENVKVRKAQLLFRVSEKCGVESYKQVLHSHITLMLTGQELLPLPKAEHTTYTAGQIGEMLGISANMVGKLANRHGLKTAEYGETVWDKSPYSAHQCQTFRYYITVVPALQKLLDAEVA